MIRYKVVTKDRRSFTQNILYFKYSKGKIVTAFPSSDGIYVFEKKKQAVLYAGYSDCIVLKVKAIGRGKRASYCSALVFSIKEIVKTPKIYKKPESFEFLADGKFFTALCKEDYSHKYWKCPDGTMLYPAVEVLE